jgi:hypothetical protein
MPGLVCGNFRLMLNRKTDIVETLQQAMTGEFVDREAGCESLIVSNGAAF